MSRRGVVAVALPLIAVVAWFDFTTNPEIQFFLIYLIPVLAVAWWGSGRDGAVIGFITAIIATASDAPWRSTVGFPILAWNALTRFVIFTAAGALVTQLREYRDRFAALDREHKKAYGREAMAARTDALTQLPNLRAFLEIIQRELARAVREGSHLCVLYIDLDDFKSVNDHYGHQTGDLVLQDVAHALQQSVRGGDVVARIGGDEFIILLWHASPADAQQVSERISRRIHDIASVYPQSQLDASIGLRFFEQPPPSADDVVQLSDAAMYREKQRRKAARAAEAGPFVH